MYIKSFSFPCKHPLQRHIFFSPFLVHSSHALPFHDRSHIPLSSRGSENPSTANIPIQLIKPDDIGANPSKNPFETTSSSPTNPSSNQQTPIPMSMSQPPPKS